MNIQWRSLQGHSLLIELETRTASCVGLDAMGPRAGRRTIVQQQQKHPTHRD